MKDTKLLLTTQTAIITTPPSVVNTGWKSLQDRFGVTKKLYTLPDGHIMCLHLGNES
jgi:hypothetical protein